MKRRTSIKSLLVILLALAAVLSSLLLAACADEPTETVTVIYEEREYGILITGYEGVLREDTELKIPATINSKDVVAIADRAFEGKGDLRSVVIPASVVAIGERAFKNCENLEYVNIPVGVTELKDEVFAGCEGLKEVNLPEGTVSIAESAFEDCTAVESLTAHGWALPFFDLSALKSLHIRGSLTATDGMFAECTRLESITLPFVGSDASATANTHFGYIFGADSAEDNAKYIPTTLKKVVITGGKVIDDSAFYGCASISSVMLPQGLETIGIGAFEGCTSLARVNLPASVKYIGNGAFASTALESATIPAPISTIGSRTFADCSALKSITLGKGVTKIESEAFDGCLGLEELRVDSIEQWLSFEFESCFDSPLYYAGRLFVGNEEAKSIVIPETITAIPENAFYRCTSVESVTLHDEVESVGSYAFAGCASLSGISFSASVKSVGTAAFSGCSSIKRLTLPASITELGSYAFNLCTSLTALELNANIARLGEAVFRSTAITHLSVGDSVTEVDPTAFKDTTRIKHASAPACVFGAINTASLESVAVTAGSEIADGAFRDCVRLKSVTVSESIVRIGDEAFRGCTALTSVGIDADSSLAAIGRGAFEDCARLTSFTLSESVETVGEEAFRGCIRLAEVYDLSSAVEVTVGADDNGAIALYAYLVHLDPTVPTAITELGDYKFIGIGTDYLLLGYFGSNTALTLPEYVNDSSYRIASLAFSGSDIRSITIPPTVEAISHDAFTGTLSIKELEASAAQLVFITPEARTGIETLTVSGAGAIDLSSLYGYESLVTLNVGAAIYDVAPVSLYMMESLAAISVDAANTAYKSVDGHLYKITSDGDVLVRACPAATDYFTLPTTVIEIGDYAFAGCKLLTNLYIEEGSVLRRIGDLAFYGCEILYSLELPASIAEIGNNAFLNCSYLSEIEFNGECAKYAAVGGCLVDKTAKTVILGFGENGTVTIPADGSVTKVAAGAIIMQKTITKLVLAKGVEYDEFALGGLPALEAIEVASDDVTYKVVDGCLIKVATKELILATSLAKIPSDGSVSTITSTAFAANTALTSVVIPDTVTSVAEGAFSGCESLVKVTTPVTFVGCFDGSTVSTLTVTGTGTLTAEMLASYTALEVLNIGKDVTVAEGALKSCSAIREINADAENTKLLVKDGCLIDKESKTVIAGLSGAAVPSDGSVTRIGAYAFAFRPELGSVYIPGTVTYIDETAFEGSDGLDECAISIDFIHLIPRDKVTTLILTGGTDLGASELDGFTALKSLTLPSTLDTLLPGLLSSHPTLTTLAVDADHPEFKVINGCLINTETKKLLAGVGSCSLPADGSVTEIGAYAFAGNDSLTSVVIPECITAYGEGAFEGCTSLERVYYALADYASFASRTAIPETATVYLYSETKPTEEGNFYYLEDGKIKIWW